MSDEKPLPDNAGENIRGPFVPDDPEYPEWAHGQLEAILQILRELGEPLSEDRIKMECRRRKVTFTNGSISAQIRNLRKPANGGFCVLTHKATDDHPTLYSYVADEHQIVDDQGVTTHRCLVCRFGPYTQLPLYQALHLYEAGIKEGDWTEVRHYLRDVLQSRGMLRSAEEAKPEPESDEPEPEPEPDKSGAPSVQPEDFLDFLHEGL